MSKEAQTAQRLKKLAELETHLSFRISRLSKLLDVQAAGVLSGSGFGLTGYRVLLVLKIFEETTAADMSRLMVVDKALISRTAAELVARGLISTRPDPTSGRQKLLQLTAEGQAAIAALETRFGDRNVRLIGELDANAAAGLAQAIDRLSVYLAEATEQPDAAPSGRG